jgi:polyhydroxyalkanoate synthase
MSDFEALTSSLALFNSRLLKLYLLSQDYKISDCTIKYWEYLMSDAVESIKSISFETVDYQKLTTIYLNNTQKYLNLLKESLSNDNDNSNACSEDRRFRDKLWCENPFFKFFSQSHLLFNECVSDVIQTLCSKNKPLQEKLKFYTQQYFDALAPSNFFLTNPRVIQKAIDTHGENLLKGLNNFIYDLERSEGKLQISMTDYSAFHVGKNIAATPGKVIYQNNLMQLIQYESCTKKVYKRPLLIIPPWINKYYILDLSKENSLVRWLVNQGYTVFIISWVNPNATYANVSFEDYMKEGPLAALDVIKMVTGESLINATGYCIGGTLLACTLAYLAKKRTKRIASAAYLATLLDFSKSGTLGTFINETHIDHLEKYLKCKGYLDGYLLFQTFNLLRPNDLIWSYFVHNYLEGEKPAPLDILFWNADYTNLPQAMLLFYLRNMYLENKLIQPNKIQLNGVSINLKAITAPSYFISAQQDHITPWQSTYSALSQYGGPSTFVLTASGHVAGIINPPAKQKYSYYTSESETKPDDAEQFFKQATQHQGSWWVHWEQWLRQYSGQKINARKISDSAIENAPGTYVKQ